VSRNESENSRVSANIRQNLELWGSRGRWEEKLKYGYVWWGEEGLAHVKTRQIVVETYLMPFVRHRIPMDIVEIGPGGGRLTAELIPLAKSLTLVDLSPAAIDICRERFKYYDHIRYHVNDGRSLDMLGEESYDLVVSWDTFVHLEKDLVSRYVAQFSAKLRPFGFACIHHAARSGQAEDGWRSNMTKALMETYAAENGMALRAQYGSGLRASDGKPYFRDCTSLLQKVPVENLER
jgi:SAM-dependent methyltransferase